MNIQLIQPAKSKCYSDNSRTGCYVPLGLISIATTVRANFPDAEIELLDGELITNQAIIEQLRPGSYVGIETKLLNYASAIEIAEAAKQMGCKVVVGGVYASAIPDTIMEHQSGIVGHIVVGYGEVPFVDIINGNDSRIIHNGNPSFDTLPKFDRSFVNLEAYIANFQKEHPTWDKRGTNIFTHMGCKYKCVFCSRQGPEKGVYFRDPKQVWAEVRGLVEGYGIDYIVDFSDAITQNIGWLREFVASKPTDINPAFHVFSTAEEINERSLELLKQINTKHIFVGIETGDKDLADKIGKGINFSPEMALRAVELITRYGMTITPSFVLGLEGETEVTLKRTNQLARQIYDITNFEEIFCSALIPFPGSIAFEKLKAMHDLNNDMLDSSELTKLWVDSFCAVDYDTIMSYAGRILDLGRYKITIKKT